MNTYIKSIAVMTACLSINANVFAADGDWFVRPVLGLSNLSDLSVTADNVAGATGETQIALDSGFAAGLGVGYQYNDNLAVEIAWEFRSNDSVVSLSNGVEFQDGNYASNTFFLNGLYYFDSSSKWRPYVGAGLAWIQEIDIDLEAQGQELSYSADGDVGFQAFAGLGYELSDRLELSGELRYLDIGDFDLSAEPGTTGQLLGLDYSPSSLSLALRYKF